MRLFSEEVKNTLSSSPLNILQVENFNEIFFGVLEVEINEKKYPVEEVAKHGGNPVVMLPIVIENVEREYPFVLLKGKQELFFNENNTEIPTTDEITEESVHEVDNEQILIDIKNLKKESIRKAQEELSRNIKIIKEQTEIQKQKKEKALKKYLESARENLVDEFTIISEKIRNEVFDNNEEKYSEIKETIDNKIQDIVDNLNESLANNFQNSAKLIDKSVKKLIKELYESNINPKVDKELKDIAGEIFEKVSDIDERLNAKLAKKADTSLIEGLNKELDAIRDTNIELNNSLNKGVQKALSRVGNIDKKIVEVSEKFNNKILETEQEITQYFDEKLSLVKEETLDITDEARKYFQDLIQESRNGLLAEIRKIKKEKPVEYILESKKGKPIVKDWDSIEKDWNKKIHDKFENYKTDLRKYISVYASGGGTNAVQYKDGGTINGNLTVTGNISASQYLGLQSGVNTINSSTSSNGTASLSISALIVDGVNFVSKANLNGGNTFSGAQNMSGQLQLTGQTVIDSNSAMTRGLADSRYSSMPYVSRLTSDQNYTNDANGSVILSLTLPAGRYLIQQFVRFGANSANSKVSISGAGVNDRWSGYRETYAQSGTPIRTGNSNAYPSQGGPWGPSSLTEYHGRWGYVDFSASVTINITASQSSSSAITTTVTAGAFLIAYPLP